MTEQEMAGLQASGMDVQLHTHHHRFPREESQARAEIHDNRTALAGVGAGPYVHFCYPSGIYDRSQFPWLSREGIASATTTRAGFNTPASPLLELDRILDGDAVSDLEFEAEICGVAALFRAPIKVHR
jgi:peptidoglycan/xylan/chitin deacetylase (PgdA/CDA1 family)